MTKRFVPAFFIFAFLFFLFSREGLASYGISPADLSFNHLSAGMELEKNYLISRTDSEKDVRVVVEVDVEDADNWIRIEPGISFIIPEGQKTKQMKIIVKVPDDILLKKYEGIITVKFLTGEASRDVSIVGGVGIGVNLTTTDLEVLDLLVRKITIPDVVVGNPIDLLLTIENRGNRKVAADELELIVYEESTGEKVLEVVVDDLDKIAPGKTEEISVFVDNSLVEGSYLSEVRVKFAGEVVREERLAFFVIGEDLKDQDKSQFRLGLYNILLYLGIILLLVSLIIVIKRLLKKKNF